MSSIRLALLACVVVMLVATAAPADQVMNPVSKFEISVNGRFDNGVPTPIGQFMGEWGDVIPLAFISPPMPGPPPVPAVLGDPHANSLLYVAIAPGKTAEGIKDIYLMYDYLPRTNKEFASGEFVADIKFPITFEGNPGTDITVQIRGGGSGVDATVTTPLAGGGSFFDVFVDINGDGKSDFRADQIGIEAAVGFGPSALSNTSHLLIELEVPLLIPEGFGTGINGELPRGGLPGDGKGEGKASGYSPAPAFWGSDITNDSVDPGATAANVRINPDGSVVVASVPEPSALLLLASGLFGLGVYSWRRRRI